MARSRASQSQDAEPANEGMEAEEQEDGGRGITKSAAARAAIAAGKAKPGEALPYMRERFGIEMSPQHFSAIKSNMKKKEREAEPPARARRSPRAEATSQSTANPGARASATGKGEGDVMTALESIKDLVGQYGADKVKRMVDLLE